MILIDAGPLAAVFDSRDAAHARCTAILAAVRDQLVSTAPALTEAFHLIHPASIGGKALRNFVRRAGITVWSMDDAALHRSFDLMDEYEDHPMDFADASLVAAAESLRATTVFTLDVGDFQTYRPRIGRSLRRFRLLQ